MLEARGEIEKMMEREVEKNGFIGLVHFCPITLLLLFGMFCFPSKTYLHFLNSAPQN